MYGPGRGLGHRPDSLHSVSMQTNVGNDLLLPSQYLTSSNYGLRTGPALLWSRLRGSTHLGQLPVTAETYADLGSKTLVLAPFRRITLPTLLTQDGFQTNLYPSPFAGTGTGVTTGSAVFTDAAVNFSTNGTVLGDVLTVASGPAAGTYVIIGIAPGADDTKVTLDKSAGASGSVTYTVTHAQGLMPLKKLDGVTAKWTATDPLGLFASCTTGTDNSFVQKNLYATLPRCMVPGWGAIYAPVLWQDASSGVFHEGINFALQCKKNPSSSIDDANQSREFVNYTNGDRTFAIFSTHTLTGSPVTATTPYNTAYTYDASPLVAGMRFFTDTRGLGREGLELPPFYGIARLFAVYEAQDYKDNGSAYNASTRALNGAGTPAINLLRQGFDGPTFWIEKDEDGDSTFTLNAAAIDIARSPNAIADFASGKYVIESSIFGFDRGSFDITKPFRLVLSRPTAGGRTAAVNNVTRSLNLGLGGQLTGTTAILPGPLQSGDQAVINYTRTPYQGDAWGSQLAYIDTPSTMGPLSSTAAYAVSSTQLDQDGVLAPNPKVVEVLASLTLLTTLGTGRLSGDLVDNLVPDLRNVGHEDEASYPPTSGVAARPRTLTATLDDNSDTQVPSSYLGCTERLPLGALFLDKDFHGEVFTSQHKSPLVTLADVVALGQDLTGPSVTSALDQSEVPGLASADVSRGEAGDLLVQTDGEVSDYGQLLTYRTARGGAVFTASGERPGAELVTTSMLLDSVTANVLCIKAMLVRNEPTSVGSAEVSAGSELMMLVATTVVRGADGGPAGVKVGTNGLGEGYSAVDLFRIEGRPLTVERTYDQVPLDSIVLTRLAG